MRDGLFVYNSYEKATHQTCLAHLLRRCHEMITDQPAWARATPRLVRDLLLEALDAQDLDAPRRAAAVIDIGERIDLLFEQAHPHDGTAGSSSTSATSAMRCSPFLTTDGVDGSEFRSNSYAL